MDFSAEGILARMKAALKNEDTKMEGSFSMDNLQAVAEELARLDAMRIVPLMNTLTDKEEDMGYSSQLPIIAKVITGLILSSGSTGVHELVAKLRESRVDS